MNLIKPISFLFLTSCFLLAGPSAFAEKDKSKKKNKTGNAEDAIEDKIGEEIVSSLFPDWPAPSFDWSVVPLVGAKYTSENLDGETEHKRTTFEGGAMAGLFGIPLVPGNAGLYLEPSGGYVWGWGAEVYKDTEDKTKTNDFSYNRSWLNLDTILLWRFYKHTLGIGGGNIIYDKDKYPAVKTASVKNDAGVLIYSWLSAHYTHKYLRVYGNAFSFDEPYYEEQDNWLHAAMAFSLLSFRLDIGPGFTVAEDFYYDAENEHQSAAKGTSKYVLATTSLNLFWKIGGSGRAKYVYDSDEEKLGDNARIKLPEESLYDPPSVAMPEDSLIVSSFLGINDLYLGFGIGWYYNLQILNMNEKDGAKKETTKNNGFGLSYTANL